MRNAFFALSQTSGFKRLSEHLPRSTAETKRFMRMVSISASQGVRSLRFRGVAIPCGSNWDWKRKCDRYFWNIVKKFIKKFTLDTSLFKGIHE